MKSRALLLITTILAATCGLSGVSAAPVKGVKKVCPGYTDPIPYKKPCPAPPGDPTPPPTPESPSFAATDVVVNENAGTATVTILKTGTTTTSSQISYATSNGTALSGTHYSARSGFLIFPYNVKQNTFTVPITNNGLVDGNHSFTVTYTADSNATISDSTSSVTIIDDDVAPPEVTPPSGTPGGSDEPAESLEGYTFRTVSDFNYQDALTAPGSNPIPPDNGIDDVGAFREVCEATQIRYADFILYFGEEGKSHLHDFNGNTGVTASSTFDTMLASGGSGCNHQVGIHANHAVQRSSYWLPALLTGTGYVLRPDLITLYYKRIPKTSTKCGPPRSDGQSGPTGICTQMPNGLKAIAGMNPSTGIAGPLNIRTDAGRPNYFNCVTTGTSYKNLAELASGSPSCQRMILNVEMPQCWDGQYLWKTNRSHVVYGSYGDWGYFRCPTSNPYLIPQVSLKYDFTLTGLDLTKLKLASDYMNPALPHGWSLHADMFIVWDARVLKIMHDNCIDGHRNANSGDLCNGQSLKGAASPSYGWTNPNRLVPEPAMPDNMVMP